MKARIIERLGQTDGLLPALIGEGLAANDRVKARLNVLAHLGGSDIKAGDWLSVDGEAGAIYRGRRDIVAERPEAELSEVERWRAGVPALA